MSAVKVSQTVSSTFLLLTVIILIDQHFPLAHCRLPELPSPPQRLQGARRQRCLLLFSDLLRGYLERGRCICQCRTLDQAHQYTQSDARLQRGIDVMLEIDTPGHTSILSKTHPEFIACPEAAPWFNYANGMSPAPCLSET